MRHMALLDFIFKQRRRKIEGFLEQNAIIVDVRSEEEFNSGHIPGSVHIPLPNLKDHLQEIKKTNKPIITCCASGIRSSQAAKYLKIYGMEAINGGGWKFLKNVIDRAR